MVCRRPGIVPSDIERQTHRFAESPFVIFENLRARKMPHDFLIRGSGCASFARTPFEAVRRTGCRITARILKREPLSAAVVLIEAFARCIHCRTSAALYRESDLEVK